MLLSYMKFNFTFGKKKASITTIVVLSLIIASLSSCLKIEEKHIWDIVYEYLQTYQPNSPLIPELQKDNGIVERDVKRTVDKAIRDYERLTGDDGRVRIPAPRYSETTVDTDVCYTDECRALGGEMRLCSPWVDNCPSSVVE
jgi:siderophore synthetase component